MSKINIIYWSGTGNTEAMANHIYNACNKENSKILSVDKATVKDAEEADVLFLGCAAMGDEVLEESEMEPFMEDVLPKDNGKGRVQDCTDVEIDVIMQDAFYNIKSA